MWKKVDRLVAVSEIDKQTMERKRTDVDMVSNGVDVEKFKNPKMKLGKNNEKRILFIGEFKWMQNRDAVSWIIKEIWPKLRAEFIPSMTDKGIKLWIIGRSIPNSVRSLTGDKSIIFDENAPKETELIYQQADVLLAPIRVGGGTSFKILESMASGVPVVTTNLGNAINARENSEIAVAETAQDFVVKIKKLLEDKNFYEIISRNGEKLIEEKYNWKIIARELDSVYESAVSYD